MKHRIIIILPLVMFFMSCSDTVRKKDDTLNTLSESERNEIMTTFMSTQDAWNAGNLDEFMGGYWKSEKLVFTGVGGPTYGYDLTLERYKKGYPDTETMGILKFTVKDLYKIDNHTALMIGQFYLSRIIGDVVGHYTLVWQEINGKWLIISDHSSGQQIQK